jgi:hypothetical protein
VPGEKKRFVKLKYIIMKKIKLRAWDNDNECFSFFDFSDLRRLAESIDSFEDYFSPGYFTDPDEKTGNPLLMLYTGFNDKNGKEIYFGDILSLWYSRDTTGTDIVKFTQEVEFRVSDGFAGVEIPFLENTEIIGNIYQTPELRDR